MPAFSLDLLDVRGGKPALVLLMVVLVAATLTDLRNRRIPNLLTLPAALIGIALHLGFDGVWGGVSALAGYLVWFAGGFLFYRWIGGIGAGDIKLLMACAAFLGIFPALYLAFFSFLLQTVWLIVRWFATGTARENLRGLGIWLYTWLIPGIKVRHYIPVGMPDRSPHGPFILAGGVGTALLWWGGHVQF